jgi:hypothetical protein
MGQKEIVEKREEDERDRWCNQARSVITVKWTWMEKRLAKEERDDSSDSDDNREKDSTVSTMKEGDATEHEKHMVLDVNMVFEIPTEFRAPESSVAELSLGAEGAMFEKPKKAGEHMKPLFIKGQLDGKLVRHMMVDGGASVNIMPWAVFERLGHQEEDLKQTNLSLSGFSGEPVEAKGIIRKELTVGSKMLPTTFFVVDIKGRYNILLGRDWIHSNECILLALHQRVVQWIEDQVEVVEVDDSPCVAITESQVDVQGVGWVGAASR